MKAKLSIYSQLNYIIFRTAIAREQKQFIKIAFAVHLSAGIYRSESGALKRAVPHFVFFILIKNKIEQSAAQSCLRKKLSLSEIPTDRTFGNRRSRYKEPSKNKAEAYLVYVELILRSDAGDARIFSKEMTHTDNHGDNDEQKEKRYYYHSDHLGSAQFVTDWRGKQYEHIEYTPYGELWIEEVAAGLDKLPFRFTGKELDEETGLYYYGARYLDPKYSRWLSGDPALNDYIPQAPVNDETKKHNENLPGMGGVFNVVNLHVYHYAGNNPVKYTDPDGRFIFMFGLSNTAGAGTGVSNNTGIFISIPLNGKDISIGTYTIYQTGAYVGLGASSGIEVTVAPFADEFSDIEGFSLVGGGSFSIWGTVGAGLEIGYNPTAKTFSEKIQSITIAGAFSIGIPGGSLAEAHTWMAYTKKTSELNISKPYRERQQIYKDVQNFFKNKDIDGLLNYLKEKNLLSLEV